MTRLAFLLVILLVYTFIMVLISNEKFGKCLPISFIFLSFELFICSIIGNIHYLKYLIAITLLICCIIVIWKRKSINRDVLLRYFNISFIFFVILFIFIYLRTKDLYLSNIDDLHYYSRLVKDVIRNGVVYTSNLKITASPGNYPPFCVLLQSVFCVLLGGYSEPNILFSMVLFSLSFFAVMFDKLEYKVKDVIKSLIIIGIIIAVTLSIQQNRTMAQQIFIYNSIYNDWLIAIIAAYIYYLVLSDQTNLFIIVCAGAALCLIKPHSLPLYLLAVFAYIVKEVFYHRKKIKEIIKPCLILLAPILIYVLVDIYKSTFDGGSMLNSSISTLSAKSTFNTNNTLNATGSVNNVNPASELLAKFSQALLMEPVMSRPLEASYILIVVIQTIILWFVSKDYKLDIIISYLIGAIGYAVMLYFTFLSRGADEGLGLVMYGRYMQTYTYIGMLLIMYLIVEHRCKLHILTMFLVLSLLFVDPDSVKYVIPFNKIEVFKEKERKELQYYFDTQYKNEKMIVLNNTNINYFALIENIVDTKGKNITYVKGNFKMTNTTLEDFIDMCKNNDLLLIGDYDDWFYDNIWAKITKTPCYNSALYKINKNDKGDIDFELIYAWE